MPDISPPSQPLSNGNIVKLEYLQSTVRDIKKELDEKCAKAEKERDELSKQVQNLELEVARLNERMSFYQAIQGAFTAAVGVVATILGGRLK